MCAGTRRARVPVLQPGVAATKPRLHVRAPTQEDLAPPPATVNCSLGQERVRDTLPPGALLP